MTIAQTLYGHAEQAEQFAGEEKAAGNIVKAEWFAGKACGLRQAAMMVDETPPALK